VEVLLTVERNLTQNFRSRVRCCAMNLTPNFTLEELIFSSTAHARGISNTPTPDAVEHLHVLAAGLERVRAILGHAMHIDSGYRSPELNHLVRGVPNSAHVTGYAADFLCPEYGTPLEIVQRLHNDIDLEFDQIIQEGTWVHISFAPAMRRQVLTAHFANGSASYSLGV
jgi:hypothetical protein